MIQDHKNTFHFPHGFLSILKIVKQQQKLTSTISALVSALQTIKAKSMVPMNLFRLLLSIEYLLLTKFEVCTLSYWPILFHPHLWPNQCRRAKKQVEKGGSITYSTDQKNVVDDDFDSHNEYLIISNRFRSFYICQENIGMHTRTTLCSGRNKICIFMCALQSNFEFLEQKNLLSLNTKSS